MVMSINVHFTSLLSKHVSKNPYKNFNLGNFSWNKIVLFSELI